jgi:hypothetical protein
MSSTENPHFTTQTGKRARRHLSLSMSLLSLSELSSASLGASILSISDEFFAEAFHLLLTKVATRYYLVSFSTHGSRFLSRSLRKASKGNLVPMALFMTDGKPVDITLTLTGKGSRADLHKISPVLSQGNH